MKVDIKKFGELLISRPAGRDEFSNPVSILPSANPSVIESLKILEL